MERPDKMFTRIYYFDDIKADDIYSYFLRGGGGGQMFPN